MAWSRRGATTASDPQLAADWLRLPRCCLPPPLIQKRFISDISHVETETLNLILDPPLDIGYTRVYILYGAGRAPRSHFDNHYKLLELDERGTSTRCPLGLPYTTRDDRRQDSTQRLDQKRLYIEGARAPEYCTRMVAGSARLRHVALGPCRRRLYTRS